MGVFGADLTRAVEAVIPALRRYARALLRDRDAADDLVQDCLERAVQSWSARRPEGDARAWMFTILHHLAVSRLRRRAARPRLVALDDIEETQLARGASQDDRLRYSELLRAVAALPEDQKSVLLLVAVERLSYAETAKILDLPLGTVMSRLSRARARLAAIDQDLPHGRELGLSPRLRSVK